MTRKDISDGVGNISTRHIQEAASYMAAEKKVSLFKKPFEMCIRDRHGAVRSCSTQQSVRTRGGRKADSGESGEEMQNSEKYTQGNEYPAGSVDWPISECSERAWHSRADVSGADNGVTARRTAGLTLGGHEKHPANPYLFPSPRTGETWDPDGFRRLHDRIIKEIGAEHVRFHDMRHTFATLSLKSGVDVRTLSETLGHFSAGFTLSTYVHSTPGMKQSAADVIGNTIRNAI